MLGKILSSRRWNGRQLASAGRAGQGRGGEVAMGGFGELQEEEVRLQLPEMMECKGRSLGKNRTAYLGGRCT